ncbi:MAG: XRE family transcriptional regulator [Gammaproteobacteria bacterium]|nr:MAG: XRE family transcriptional regulator [Gammaproteobacteria bacterium]
MRDITMQNIGARLRAALEAKGLPCREVASKAGIDQSYLLRLEKGMFEAGSSPLRAIANALACSLAYVYGEQEALEGKEELVAKLEGLSDEALEVARAWQGLSERQREAIKAAIDRLERD